MNMEEHWRGGCRDAEIRSRQYPPDLIRSGVGGCWSIVDCCQSRAQRLARSISPRRVQSPAVGHVVRCRTTARGHTHAGRTRLVASRCAQRPADPRHLRLSIYVPKSVTRRSGSDRQIRPLQYVDFLIAGTWSGTRHSVAHRDRIPAFWLKFFRAPCENIRSQMQKGSKDEKAFDVGCRGNLLRSLFPCYSAGCGKGLRVLPQRHYLIHATVRLRHIGAVPGDVVRARRRLLPESVARQRRRRVRLRAGCPQDVRLRTASPEIARGARSRDRDEDQRQSKRRTPAVG